MHRFAYAAGLLRLGLFVVVPLTTIAPAVSLAAQSSTDHLNTSAEAQIFLESFELITRFHAAAPEDSVLWEAAIDGILEALDDPYAVVFTPEEYGQVQESATGNYAGIGVRIMLLQGRVTVAAVFRETPAERAGMLVGDQIVWVEGEDAREWSLDQARDAIRGEPGTIVHLRLARDGFTDPVPMMIERGNVHVPAVTATRLGDVGYFFVNTFARGVAGEMDAALTEIGDASAIILDLRRNPGGFLDESLQMADLFLAPGKGIASADMTDPLGKPVKQHWPAEKPARKVGTPVIVLVDEYSASAAEIVAGALQDNDRAVVLGERTFGKGVVQTEFALPGERRMRITTGAWYTPLGRSLHRQRHRDFTFRPDEDLPQETIATALGRELESGGGIFPDLVIPDDTLRTAEQALLSHAYELQIPFGMRVEEYAYSLAKTVPEGRIDEPLPSSAFDGFVEELLEAGMKPEIVEDETARAYLEWRVRLRYLNRTRADERALLVQAERDRVLAEALRLAGVAESPTDLFALVKEVKVSEGAGTGETN